FISSRKSRALAESVHPSLCLAAPYPRKATEMKRSFSALILVAIAALIGCTVGPNYHRPAVPVPAAFRAPDPLPTAQPASLADLEERLIASARSLRALTSPRLRRSLAQLAVL